MEDASAWSADDTKTFREMIRHETDLINHRLTWLATLQGFLFAALSFATDTGQKFMPVLVIVGIVSSVSVLMALILADKAIRSLLNEWGEKSKHYEGPPVIGYAFAHPGYRFVLPWFILPLLFAATWVAVYFEM